MAGMVAADRRHDRLDFRITDHAVNVSDPVLRRVGDEPALVEGMQPQPHLEAERLQVLHPAFDAVGKPACPAPGGADNAHRISGP